MLGQPAASRAVGRRSVAIRSNGNVWATSIKRNEFGSGDIEHIAKSHKTAIYVVKRLRQRRVDGLIVSVSKMMAS